MSESLLSGRTAVLLASAGLSSMLTALSVAPALTNMAPDLAPGTYGIFLAKQVVTVPALAMLVSSPIVGWCAERTGYRVMLIAALVIFLLAGTGGYFIYNPWVLIASRFLVGLGALGMLTSTYGLTSYYFDGETRARLLGIMSGVGALLGVLIVVAAGFLVKYFAWHSVFLLFLSVILPLAGAYWFITDHDGARTPIYPPTAETGEKAPLAALLGVYVLGAWLSALTLNPTVQFPFMLAERGITDPGAAAIVVAALVIAMTIAAPFFGWLTSRLNTRLMFAMLLFLVGIGHLLGSLLMSFTAMVAGSVLMGVVSAFIQPALAHYVFSNLPAKTHARAIGGMIGAIFLGTCGNPFVLTPLSAVLGMSPAITLLGTISLIAAALFLAAPLVLKASPAKG